MHLKLTGIDFFQSFQLKRVESSAALPWLVSSSVPLQYAKCVLHAHSKTRFLNLRTKNSYFFAGSKGKLFLIFKFLISKLFLILAKFLKIRIPQNKKKPKNFLVLNSAKESCLLDFRPILFSIQETKMSATIVRC